MCEPATFVALGMSAEAAATAATVASVASTAASVGGTILSVYGQQQQAQAAKDSANFQAAVQRNNQILAERRAEDTLKRGETEARQAKARASQFEAEQLLGLAAQGGDVTEGSNVDLLADTAQASEFDAQQIKSNAERIAFNERIQAQNFGSQAALSQSRADNTSPLLEGTTSLLSGVGNVADRWYRNN